MVKNCLQIYKKKKEKNRGEEKGGKEQNSFSLRFLGGFGREKWGWFFEVCNFLA